MATVVSTVLVLVVTGHMHQLVIKFERRLMALDLLHHRSHAAKLKKALEEAEEAEAIEESERIVMDKALHLLQSVRYSRIDFCCFLLC